MILDIRQIGDTTEYKSDYVWFIDPNSKITILPNNYEELLSNNGADIIPIKYFGKETGKCYIGKPYNMHIDSYSYNLVNNPISSKIISTKVLKKIGIYSLLNELLPKYAKTIKPEISIEYWNFDKNGSINFDKDFSRLKEEYTDDELNNLHLYRKVYFGA